MYSIASTKYINIHFTLFWHNAQFLWVKFYMLWYWTCIFVHEPAFSEECITIRNSTHKNILGNSFWVAAMELTARLWRLSKVLASLQPWSEAGWRSLSIVCFQNHPSSRRWIRHFHTCATCSEALQASKRSVKTIYKFGYWRDQKADKHIQYSCPYRACKYAQSQDLKPRKDDGNLSTPYLAL